MKKPNFKAMALMGITGGIALCSSASASEIIPPESTNTIDATRLLAASCSSCGGRNFTAYQPHGCSGQQQHYMPQGSCSASPQGGFTAYQPSNSPAQPQSYYNTPPQQGQPYNMPQNYNAPSEQGQPYMQQNYNAPSQGQPYNMPQSYNAPQRPQSGCSGAQPPAYSSRMSQWESNGRIAEGTTMNGKTTEESETLSQLNEENKAIFRGLDPAGKLMVIQEIRKAGPNADRNQIVKEVAQKMSEKRAKANAPKY